MDASPSPNFTTQLRQERIRRNWRQQDLADQLGTTVVTVKRWERGSQQPSAYFCVKLCALFGKSAEELGLVPEVPQTAAPIETEGSASVEVIPLNTQTEMNILALSTLQNSFEGNPNLFFALKFLPPSLRPILVSRPRLIEGVNNAMQHVLTFLCASAGSGKSTLLSLWYANSSPISRTWVSLDEADNEPSRFWIALIGAIQTCFPTIGQRALTMLRSSHPLAIEMILASLLADINTLPEHVVIILDDYHVIKNQTIHQAFAFLLEHVSPRIHFVLATRTLPPLSIARLRVQGQCLEIQGQDLLFTLEEATAFFHHVMALPLSETEITALVQRTEGWIAGMQLAALSLQQQGNIKPFLTTFTGNHRYLVDYLAEEVLNGLSEQTQSFLLSTSLLDRLTGPLCDAVLAQNGSHKMLRSLEQANLFLVPLDEQQKWYRYHHLFGEFLRNRLLLNSSELISVVHHRAAQWYEHNDFIDEAIKHLFAAADFYQAASVVERHCETYMKRGQITTLLRWMQTFPDEVFRAHPSLSVWYAALLCSTGLSSSDQLDAAEYRLQNAEWALRAREQNPEGTRSMVLQENQVDVQYLLSRLAVVRVTLASFRGDVKQALELSHQAYEHLPAGTSYSRAVLIMCLGIAHVLSGNFVEAEKIVCEAEMIGNAAHYHHLALTSACIRAYMVKEQGHFHQAAERYHHILQRANEEGQLMAISMASIGMGELHYYWNELAIAESSLLRGLNLGQQGGNGYSLACGIQLLALIKQAYGDTKGAFELINQCECQALRSSPPQRTLWLGALRAYLSLKQGDVETAVHWAQQCGLSASDTTCFLDEFIYLSFAQVLSLMERFDEAETLLNQLLDLAKAEGRVRSMIEIRLHQTALYQKQGKSEHAQEVLLMALSRAEPEGIIRIFLDREEPLKVLLSRILATRKKNVTMSMPSPKYIEALIRAIDQKVS